MYLYLASVGVNPWVTLYSYLVSLSCFSLSSERKPFLKIFKAESSMTVHLSCTPYPLLFLSYPPSFSVLLMILFPQKDNPLASILIKIVQDSL